MMVLLPQQVSSITLLVPLVLSHLLSNTFPCWDCCAIFDFILFSPYPWHKHFLSSLQLEMADTKKMNDVVHFFLFKDFIFNFLAIAFDNLLTQTFFVFKYCMLVFEHCGYTYYLFRNIKYYISSSDLLRE